MINLIKPPPCKLIAQFNRLLAKIKKAERKISEIDKRYQVGT